MTERSSNHVIAIDGPAAAGKTTVAKALADRVGAMFLDTGLLYRAVTRAALDAGLSPTDEEGLVSLLATTRIDAHPSAAGCPGPSVLLNGKDVTSTLRQPEIDSAVSAISAHPRVREALLPLQRSIAQSGKTVMVGRDIATVVVPDASVKIYLDASLDERARRRFSETSLAGENQSLEQIRADLARRDRADSKRETAPLQRHDDAVWFATDGLSVDHVVERLAELVSQKWDAADVQRVEA